MCFAARSADLNFRVVFRGRYPAKTLIQTELIDVHVPGLRFESLTKLFEFFTSGETVLSSFALPDGPLDHMEG